MASSPTALRLQNKRQKAHVGTLKHPELNKVPTDSRVKLNTTQFSKRGAENKDPNECTKPAKGPNKPAGVSRLPVLVRTQQSAIKDVSSKNPADKRWGERPLLGKAQKRKTCTKPVPFSFSQSRTHNQKCAEASSESAAKSVYPTTHRTSCTPAKAPSPAEEKECKKHATSVVPNKDSVSSGIHTTTEFELNIPGKGKDVNSAIQKDLSTKLGQITLAHTAHTKDGRFSPKDQADCRPSAKQTIQSRVSAEGETGVSERAGNAVVGARTPRVSTRPSGPDAHVHLPQRVSVKKKKKGCGAEAITENPLVFSPDPSALRSILLNEGIKVRGPDGATPRASTCPSARRVPLRKPQTHTTASVGEAAGGAMTFSPDPSALHSILLNEGVKQGAVRTPRACPSTSAPSIYSAQRVPVPKAPSETSTAGAVSFSPDSSALRSILHNEGVKAGSSGVMTPRVPFCPSRGATYTAQRVPVKKGRTGEAAHTGISHTPGRRWMSQQVPISQSRSVMRPDYTHKKHPMNISPGLGETHGPSMATFSQQEEKVVQRLFQEEPEHEENEQMEDGVDQVTPGRAAQRQQSAEHKSKPEGETKPAATEPRLAEKEKLRGAQPFIQAPNRQSVIVFSSGQKLLPWDGASVQTSQPAAPLQPSADRSNRSQSELNTPVSPGKQRKAKASSLSLAVCALRRRLPPLEEMFLDEECATYTSCQQSWPCQRRCLNPVASTLLFQDSTRFVPISATVPTLSPAPHLSSPIKV